MIDVTTQADIDALFWFHSFDFGDGRHATGVKSMAIVRAESEAYFVDIQLAGASVLDIGTWNGAMAFEAERRGAARVLASDHYVWSREEFSRRAPFELAHRLLRSKVEARDIDVPDIRPETVGTFDIVLFLGVFYHLFDPVALTRQISTCADDLLILETWQDATDEPRPAMIFYPADELNRDASNWWGPNPQMIAALLRHCGFGRVFYRSNPGQIIECGEARRRERGIFFAFRDDAAIARRGARTGHWWDMDDPAQREAALAPPVAEPAPNKRRWFSRRLGIGSGVASRIETPSRG